MRAIKFRAFDKTHNKMLKVRRLEFSEDGLITYLWNDREKLPEGHWPDAGMNKNLELMQFTGIKDKNNKEIYEGDIVRDPKGYGVVYYTAPGFTVTEDGKQWWLGKGDVMVTQLVETEVIGNIYENPDLLDPHKETDNDR